MTKLSDSKYIFPLSIQLPPVDDIYDQPTGEKFLLLQKYGFSGVELNITDPDRTDPAELRKYLGKFGLHMTMFASGALAKKHNLSLSHTDRDLRLKAVKTCRNIIEYAAEFKAGVILGFMKGAAGGDREKAKKNFQESIGALSQDALTCKVPILIEATNHYESDIANTTEEAVTLIKEFNNPYLKVLPDTYHMNIEERSSFGTLVKYQGFYESIHISDNNRYFPGFGGLDFFSIINFLVEIGYKGAVAIEGKIKSDFQRDLEISMEYLGPVLSKNG